MPKTLYVVLFLLFVLNFKPVFAQQDSVYYFNNYGSLTQKDNDVAYKRVINFRTPNGFQFTEYKKDGTRIVAFATGDIKRPNYNGVMRSYSKEGKLESKSVYNDGQNKVTTFYHPNGKVKNIIQNTGHLKLLVYEADSAGNINIEEGKGIQKLIHQTYVMTGFDETYDMNGPYINGLKNGKWQGITSRGNMFTENYADGKLVDGLAITPDGKKRRYNSLSQLPDFKHKRAEVENFILTHLKNPADTLKLQSFYKGKKAALTYTITTTGDIAHIYGYSDSGEHVRLELSEACHRVKPGSVRGILTDYVVMPNFYFGYKVDITPNTLWKELSNASSHRTN